MARNVADKSGIALELPFTLVGAVVVGGAIGYFLDKWLHTTPWLMVVIGSVGFFGGVREVLRRLPADGGNNDGK
ncbi:MAG TPA: AtpZ/AtpI family protein [Candidatus Dormibacteraeota bacterium]|nr:AtpZ/AtpI family protein [Candidatus Dormibacteraeota bacterium]